MDKEFLIFPFVQLFTYCQDGVATSKLLICWTGNWKFCDIILMIERNGRSNKELLNKKYNSLKFKYYPSVNFNSNIINIQFKYYSSVWSFHYGLALLWLWHWPAAAALNQPLTWELPCATGAALKRRKKKNIYIYI